MCGQSFADKNILNRHIKHIQMMYLVNVIYVVKDLLKRGDNSPEMEKSMH